MHDVNPMNIVETIREGVLVLDEAIRRIYTFKFILAPLL